MKTLNVEVKYCYENSFSIYNCRYVFDEVQENSMEIWKFERYKLIREYDSKPGLVPPFVVLEHIYRMLKAFWKKYIRKHKENCKHRYCPHS